MIGTVGDDTYKNVIYVLTLEAGIHPVRWDLTGGYFRHNLLKCENPQTGVLLRLTHTQSPNSKNEHRQIDACKPLKSWKTAITPSQWRWEVVTPLRKKPARSRKKDDPLLRRLISRQNLANALQSLPRAPKTADQQGAFYMSNSIRRHEREYVTALVGGVCALGRLALSAARQASNCWTATGVGQLIEISKWAAISGRWWSLRETGLIAIPDRVHEQCYGFAITCRLNSR